MNILGDRTEAETYAAILAGSTGDFDLVCIESGAGSSAGELPRFDAALLSAGSDRAVVMVATTEHYEDPRWHAALGHPNVAFRRHPASRETILDAFEEAKARKRPPDPLAIHVWRIRKKEQAIVTLRYGLYSARTAGDEALDRWETEARAVFGPLSREELISRVSAPGIPGRATLFDEIVFPPEEFPDVCVDFLRTLCEGSSIREDVLSLVKKRSIAQPITIWTGGDLHYAENVLRQNRIPWKIIPRPVTSEIRVAVIVDDLPEREFRMQQPLISFHEYIQV